MSKTRADYKRELEYMLIHVRRVKPDLEISVILLNKKARLDDIMKLDFPALQSIKCVITEEGATNTIMLEPWDIGKIGTIRRYIHHNQDTFDDDISSIKVEDYNKFKISAEWTHAISINDDLNDQLPLQYSGRSSYVTPSLVVSLKKTIKRGLTTFKDFKDGKLWDQWKRKLIVTARAQDVEDVLDPEYLPISEDDKALF